ncbi:hypothetical protein FA15DRAFT_658104 [Coprinopsis marcescibilis]|uniref:F-box domain-containing protein n=1 Tax=Coprinopsis marcescibilis TaxID=230819 RepID=A0A5C3KMN9_COPMA|nr:hypothetical protein FA15DRAFT_658104 [Coprinopsis marcescibilis]
MHVNEIPPETLALTFELGITAWGIKFLPPICQVCKSWNIIASTTPRLWGIIDLDRRPNLELVNSQISHAKSAPLTIFMAPAVGQWTKRSRGTVDRLLQLSQNWISASVPFSVFNQRSWPEDYPNLEELALSAKRRSNVSPDVALHGGSQQIHRQKTRLRRLTTEFMDKPSMLPLLSSAITSLSFISRESEKFEIEDILGILSLVPNVQTLRLLNIHPKKFQPSARIVTLPHLTTLETSWLKYTGTVLASVRAPALQSLTIERFYYRSYNYDPAIYTLSPFFSQWSDPQFTPTKLHTLKFAASIRSSDIPYLARFLARLPNLVRLILEDIEEVDSSKSLAEALSTRSAMAPSPDSSSATSGFGAGPDGHELQWLCPSLMVLHLESDDLHLEDLIRVVLARGVKSTTGPSVLQGGCPKRLRDIAGLICTAGREDERRHLESLVDSVDCSIGVDDIHLRHQPISAYLERYRQCDIVARRSAD